MKRILLLLVLALSNVLHAQDASPVLYWATDGGVLGRYDPATHTQLKQQLEMRINTNQVRWLPNGGVFVYEPDETSFQTIDADAGKILCSLTLPSPIKWDVLSVSDTTLALYESVDAQTRITRLNWRTCATETLGTIDGILLVSSLSPDMPLLALETIKTSDSGLLAVYILDLAARTIKTLNVTPWNPESRSLYWIQDSRYLVIGGLSPIALYERATDTIHTVDRPQGIIWLGTEASFLHKTIIQDGNILVQLWTFEDGQAGRLLTEIPDETYDHLPNFSPQNRYYAYSRASIPDEVSIFDLQAGTTRTYASGAGLWRWSGDGQWLGVLPQDTSDIQVYNAQTGEQRSYTGSVRTYGGSGMWSPVGQTLIFWQIDDETQTLMMADMADGTAIAVYTRAASDYPLTMEWSPDGAYVYLNTIDIRADGQMEGCHLIVTISDRTTDMLGCDQTGHSVHWE